MVSIIFPLLLQKPSPNSKTKDHVRYLVKRLIQWKEGRLDELICEGKAIQNRLVQKKQKNPNRHDRFIRLMEEGKISAALRCIGSLQCGVLDVTAEVLEDLRKKHPEPKTATSGSLFQGPLPQRPKDPGVRPIGIGEVLRRIISSATVALLKPELVQATAPLQTCAGLAGGIEASIHAMRQMFMDENTEAILLVDASNAFNSLNRQAALHNAQYSCPEMSQFLKNIYQCNAELFFRIQKKSFTLKRAQRREGRSQWGSMPLARQHCCNLDVVVRLRKFSTQTMGVVLQT